MSRKSLIPQSELRRLADRLVDIQGRLDLVERSQRATQLSNSSLEGGSLTIRDVNGNVRGAVGMQPSGNSGVRTVNNPPPFRPNTPQVTQIPAGVAVTWNGELINGVPDPDNFSHVDVYFSGAGPDFIHGPTNLIGRFHAAGSIPITPLLDGSYYARLVAVNKDVPADSSDPSLTGGPTQPGQVVADDVLDGIIDETKLAAEAVTEAKIAAGAVSDTKIVAGAVLAEKIAAGAVLADKIAASAVTAEKIAALAVTADKVAANAIEAGHIQAGAVDAEKLSANLIVAGTSGGNRVQINADEGIEQWLDGERTLWIPPNGNAQFQGQVLAGTPSQHIALLPSDVETSFPRMIVQDDTSTRRVAMYYQTDSLWLRRETLTGTPGDIGAARGGQLTFQPGLAGLAYHSDTTGVILGDVFFHADGGAKMTGRRSSGGELGSWDVQESGNCWLTAENGLSLESQGAAGGHLFMQAMDGDVFMESVQNNTWVVAKNDVNIEANGVFLRNDQDPGDDTFGQMRIAPNGEIRFYTGGTSFVAKSFIIDHPDDPDRWLVHGCTESPMAGVEYWGEVEIVGGEAKVELPAYFESLTLPENRQVQLTPIDELCMVAASRIEDGKFAIKCSGPDGTKVSWLVKAERKGAAGFPVEPLKSEVDVRGDGPYRYLASPTTRAQRPQPGPSPIRPERPKPQPRIARPDNSLDGRQSKGRT